MRNDGIALCLFSFMSKMPLAGRSRIFSFTSGNGFNGEHGMFTFQNF